MERLEFCDDSSPDNTTFNEIPVGFRKITEAEFATSIFFKHSPSHIEYRQIHVPVGHELCDKGKARIIICRIFWFFDKTGIAISNDYWAKKVEYFACGCNHTYQELSQDECKANKISHYGMCYHVYRCSVCGYVTAYDSSD